MKSFADVHGPQRMNPNEFGDPLTFLIVPPAGQTVCLFSKASQQLSNVLF